MRKEFLVLGLVLLAPAAQAQQKFSTLPIVSPQAGNTVVGVQGGRDVQYYVSQIGGNLPSTVTFGDVIVGGPGASQIQDSSALVRGYATLPVSLDITKNVVMSGANGIGTSALFWGGSVGGTCTGAGQPCYANNIFANGFAVTWSVGQTAAVVSGNLNVATNFGGANQVGGFVNLQSTLNMVSPTGNSGNAFYASANFFAQTAVSDPGSLFAINPQVLVLNGGSSTEASGGETDVAVATGGSTLLSYGQKVVLLAANKVAASTDSGGFLVAAASGATNTLLCGYCFGQNGGDHGIAPTGALLGVTKTGTSQVAYGIFFSHASFSGATLAGPNGSALVIQTGSSRNFTVNDGGNGTEFNITSPATTVTAYLNLAPGVGGGGAVTLTQGGTGTGGIIINSPLNLSGLASGTPSTYACFDSSMNLISSAAPC